MMADEFSRFNAAPIMLRRPSSLAADDRLFGPDQHSHFYEVNDDDEEAVIVPQHLEPEQYRFEFPPKSRLRALAYLDQFQRGEEFSYFDESSFTSSSSAACSSVDKIFNSTLLINSSISSSSRSEADEVGCLTSEDQLDLFIESITSSYGMDTQASHMLGRARWDHRTSPSSRNSSRSSSRCMSRAAGGNDELQLVDDSNLSPLQLPARANDRSLAAGRKNRVRKLSSDSTTTVQPDPVGPSSFLLARCSLNSVDEDTSLHVYNDMPPPSDDDSLPVFRSESVPVMDDDDGSMDDSDSDMEDSRVVLIKLRKGRTAWTRAKPLTKTAGTGLDCRPLSNQTCLISDEGYDDDESDDEPPIESASVFLPLSKKEQTSMVDHDVLRTEAATRIQAAWRGYQARKTAAEQSNLAPTQRVLAQLARICGGLQRKKMMRADERIHLLEQRLHEETAMRTAFEKAMEDMTILIDHQQKVLYDRIEQEVHLRQAYERKMEEALGQMQPLEHRLHEETLARIELENMMAHVLGQVSEMQEQQQHQAKADADAKRIMQRKLSEAMSEIATLKKHQLPTARPQAHTTTTATTTTKTTKSTATATSATNITTTSANTPPVSSSNARKHHLSSSNTSKPASSVSRPSATAASSVSRSATPRRTLVPASQTPRVPSRMDTKRPTAVPRSHRTVTPSPSPATTRKTIVSRR
ncbi:hypothetical protein BCR43DRAFT_497066 [Syncephalastrum racemosum]|uniref:Uncharacterized protein n=1 Tax=Syncephalastrum racemosum TaxID=13706 RepID=A0A1X2H530_SYNRA|nr:hypothetical protein BCR43DRAFT_497066 [Syncephalastrum racemosum]